MLAILPVLTFLSIMLVVRKYQMPGWRGSFLFAAVVWGVLVTGMTELLSLLRWLDFWPVAGAWGIVLVLLWLMLARGSRINLKIPPKLQQLSNSPCELALLAGVLLIIAAIGAIAWRAPPNNFDSMTYHMSRVMHWVQNKSVTFYPTVILRQLHQDPWGEFAILHFQILAGVDRWANFLQWFSMVGSIVGVTLIAKELNARRRGQIYAAVICATIPMGILQASSTQTDYVISFWLVCFVYFSMLLRKKASLLLAIVTGAALGLGVLTKATMYLYALPFLAWLAIAIIKARSPQKMRYVGLALVIALVINSGHTVRNYQLYGNPLGPGQEGPNLIYANEAFTLPATTSNIIRNLGLHLGTPFERVNTTVENTIFLLHKLIGISADDARTTYWGVKFSVPFSRHEDYTGNLVHLLLISACCLLYLLQRPRDREVGWYMLAILAAFVLFSFYLKWQLWNSRLQLPLFVLSASFTGLTIAKMRSTKIANLAMALLIVLALPWVFYNFSRPMVGEKSIFTTGRIEQYFSNRPEVYGPYYGAAQVLTDLHCSEVGLDIDWEDYEYPLWVLLQEKTDERVRLAHVNVTNISQKLYDGNYLGKFNLCAIFSVNDKPTQTIKVGDNIFQHYWSTEDVHVYRRER